jgi:hypothetical protein
MNLRVACLVVWSVGLGLALCVLLGRGIAEDLPPCNGWTTIPPEKCGQDIPCQTYYDSNDNSIQDPDEPDYVYPDAGCSGYSVVAHLVSLDMEKGTPSQRAEYAWEHIPCVSNYPCGWRQDYSGSWICADNSGIGGDPSYTREELIRAYFNVTCMDES